MTLAISPQKLAKLSLVLVLAALAFVYAADYFWFRARMMHPRPSDPVESWTIPRVLAIPEKGNKTS